MTNSKLGADILQNISVQNVNKAFVYITDWTSPLRIICGASSKFYRYINKYIQGRIQGLT